MFYNRKVLLVFISLLSFIWFSCENTPEEETGQISFSFLQSNGKTKRAKIEDAVSLLVTIENDLGEKIYESQKIDLIDFNGNFLSEPLPMLVGNYTLTEFLVIDENSNVIFATPISESPFAYLVNSPLPINIEVTKDNIENITPEVLAINDSDPEDFGYTTFSLNEVQTFNFELGVMIYNDQTEALELTDFNLKIEDNGGSVLEDDLQAENNSIRLRDGYDNYEITISKNGFNTYNHNFTQSELLEFIETNPLIVILDESTSGNFVLTLQPGPEDGKDALIAKGGGGRWSSSENYGNSSEFIAATWTWSGNIGYERCLIDFDISDIPSNTTINSAKLSFYYQSEPSGTTGHSIGNNKCFLQKVTSDWDEQTVTWDNQPNVTSENQVTLEASTVEDQDYPDIDITAQIQDKYSNPDSHFGFLFRLETESTYRSMYFASSDHSLTQLRPKLVIEYSVSE